MVAIGKLEPGERKRDVVSRAVRRGCMVVVIAALFYLYDSRIE